MATRTHLRHVPFATQHLATPSREGRVTARHVLGYRIPRRWRWSVVDPAAPISFSKHIKYDNRSPPAQADFT